MTVTFRAIDVHGRYHRGRVTLLNSADLQDWKARRRADGWTSIYVSDDACDIEVGAR